MEHKKYIVAVATDTSFTKAVNKSPVSIFNANSSNSDMIFSILPNNQLRANSSGVIFNIWSSHSSINAAKNRRFRLSKIAMFDTDYEFEVTKKGHTVRGGNGNRITDVE